MKFKDFVCYKKIVYSKSYPKTKFKTVSMNLISIFFIVAESDMCPVKLYKIFTAHRPVVALHEDAHMYLRSVEKPKDMPGIVYNQWGKTPLPRLWNEMNIS